jgi:hypothetical protein
MQKLHSMPVVVRFLFVGIVGSPTTRTRTKRAITPEDCVMGLNAILVPLDAKTLEPSRNATGSAPNQVDFFSQSEFCADSGGSRVGAVPAQCFDRITVGRGSTGPRNEGITFQRFWL